MCFTPRQRTCLADDGRGRWSLNPAFCPRRLAQVRGTGVVGGGLSDPDEAQDLSIPETLKTALAALLPEGPQSSISSTSN